MDLPWLSLKFAGEINGLVMDFLLGVERDVSLDGTPLLGVTYLPRIRQSQHEWDEHNTCTYKQNKTYIYIYI